MTQSPPSITAPFKPEEATLLLYRTWREKLIMPLLLGMLALGVFVLIPAVISAENLFIKALFIVAYSAIGIVTVVKFSYEVRISAFLLVVYALGLGELLRYGILGDSAFFFLGLVVFATLLFSPWAGVASIGMISLTIVTTAWLMLGGIMPPIAPYTPSAKIADWISGGVMVIAFGAIIVMGFQRLEKTFFEAQKQIDDNLTIIRDERNNLEKKVIERTLQLRRVNEIGRALTAILNPDELLTRAAHLIGDEFECYYTAIFLTDATEQWAELKAATGEAGKVLRENKHHMDINGKNPVGAAIRARQAVIISNTEEARAENPAQPFTHFSWHGISISPQVARTDNPLLPHTRSQITLPLAIGERVIGALEMHSSQVNAFTQQDADTYQNMANHVAVAIENSKLFMEAQQSIREMGVTQQQYLEGVWQALAAEQNYEYTLGNNDPSDKGNMEVPLILRDQVIGQVNMSTYDEEWDPRRRNLVESIAAQAALALENARLVEESQSIAMRERLANEVTSKIWASTTIDSILQTTVRELGRALEAAEVDIEVSMGEEDE